MSKDFCQLPSLVLFTTMKTSSTFNFSPDDSNTKVNHEQIHKGKRLNETLNTVVNDIARGFRVETMSKEICFQKIFPALQLASPGSKSPLKFMYMVVIPLSKSPLFMYQASGFTGVAESVDALIDHLID
jgi:hypothetical protein